MSRSLGVQLHGRLPIRSTCACSWAINLSNLVPLESRLCETHIAAEIGWIYSIPNFLECSTIVVVQRHNHLPFCPYGQQLVKSGSGGVQTLWNAYIWKCWTKFPYLKFFGISYTCSHATVWPLGHLIWFCLRTRANISETAGRIFSIRKKTNKKTQTTGALLLIWINLITALISDYVHYNVWNKISYAFSNFNVCTIEVWEWTKNYWLFTSPSASMMFLILSGLQLFTLLRLSVGACLRFEVVIVCNWFALIFALMFLLLWATFVQGDTCIIRINCILRQSVLFRV